MKGPPVSLDQRFAEEMGALLGPSFPSEIGLAVSGGGDSMAMLALAHGWARVFGVRLWVVTVNHGFREEAAAEAEMVAAECAVLGWPHASLHWSWDGHGNAMEAAREARVRLIAGWRGRLRHVLMAHTQDDVAETFLMRLARGSGVDGLSKMQARRVVDQPRLGVGALAPMLGEAPAAEGCRYPVIVTADGTAGRDAGVDWWVEGETFEILRPCLAMRRADLRHYVRVLQVPFVDDPSNENPAYARARIRAALPGLSGLGLDVPTLAATAERMARARNALRLQAADAWERIGHEARHRGAATGDLLLERDGFAGLPREVQLRLLAAAIGFVSGTVRRPRAARLEEVLDRVLSGGGGTLGGCEILAERTHIRVFREYAALEAMAGNDDPLWDGRWLLTPEARQKMGPVRLRPLGDAGWQSLSREEREGLTYRAARSLPMVATGAGGARISVAQGTRDILYRPFGKDGLTFAAFLMTH
ncbi:tRNA(Ile)-lysidine synthetase-like protein [Sagittula stellata E-37]|uniref:tRNA(Ile)-lysidine synthase n=2 Tax=Sagittula stellata TaxID=52603 RepID=A3JY18_SAGS3|nr:tRNA(Ile)-lysidine synthetase-like protein [Sagittula stellata E-37]